MKNIFTLLLLVFLSANISVAQVTLNSANMPSIGDDWNYVQVDPSGMGPGAAGASTSWDFSSFTETGDTLKIRYQDPSLTPSAGSFSTADVAWFDSNGNYRYFKNNSGSFVILGEVNATFTLSQPVAYSDNEIYFTFPFDFGASSVDSFSGGITSPLGTGLRWGEDSVEVDGSGSLDLGDTTYSDVIRIRRHVIWTDSVNSPIAGDIVNNFDFLYYEWWTADGVGPVMQFLVRDYVFGMAPVNDTLVYFFDEVLVSNDPGIDPLVGGLEIFPNPSSGLTNIALELKSPGVVKFEILDMQGRLVKELNEESLTIGNHFFQFDAKELPSGMYFVRMDHPQGVLSRKVILK